MGDARSLPNGKAKDFKLLLPVLRKNVDALILAQAGRFFQFAAAGNHSIGVFDTVDTDSAHDKNRYRVGTGLLQSHFHLLSRYSH